MENNNVYIRAVSPADAEALLKIYAPYIKNTAITFEYDVPSVNEFRKRIENTLVKHSYIAAVYNGEIAGYAYTSDFVGRRACDWSVETTVYLQSDMKKQGLGKMLYKALEDISRAQNIINLNACIAYPDIEDEYLNKNSVQFHEHIGYKLVGKFNRCGYKFGNWYNLIWMEKMIGEHSDKPLPLIPFSELSSEVLKELGIKER